MSDAHRRKQKIVRRDGCEAVIADEKEGQALHIICPVCDKLLHDPVQAECGDRFCHYCIEKLVSSADRICPRCKATVHQDRVRFFKDVFAAKEISSVKVYCSSKRHATHDMDWCLWSGILAKFPDHEELCEYVRVECTECLEHIKRLDLVTHKLQTCPCRRAKCRLCSTELAWKETKAHEDTDCPEALISCPSGCSAQPLPRKNIEQHRKSCPMQTVNCYYNNSGCEYKGHRVDLRTHHDSSLQYHLQLVDKSSQEAKTRATEASQAAAKVGKLEQTIQGCVIAIDQQQAIIQTFSDKVESLEAANQKMMQMIASLQASFAKLENQVKKTEERRSRDGSVPSDDSVLVQKVDDNCSRLARMDRTVALHDLQLSDQSMRQDILEVRSQTGTMVWKISELERRLREAMSGKTPSLYSPPFFTSACGYKMCLRLYLNGDGAGHSTHMSLFFAIMRGDFDGLLKWPFQQKVTLMLLNQAPIGAEAASGHVTETFKPDITSSSFHRPDSDMNVATGCPTFAPLSMLQIGSRFVRDDSLFVKVSVNLAQVPVPDAHLSTGRLL